MTTVPLAATASAGSAERAMRLRGITVDGLVGGAIVVGLWLTAMPPDAMARPWQWLLASAALAAVTLRRALPRTTTAVASVATVLAWMLEATADPGIMPGLCLFAVAERRGVRVFPWWLWLATALLTAVALVVGGGGAAAVLRTAVLTAVIVSAAWALGTRSRQVRQEAAARARAEERLRLARDVHDILSHSLGTIGVQAGIAAHVTSLDAESLRRTLREVESDARASLAELRALLRTEREGAAEAAKHDRAQVDPPHDPVVPPRSAILAVRENLERVGIVVDLDVPAAADTLPLVQQQLIRRIAQEAGTNVIRHSGASRCRIVVRIERRHVSVEVRDDGHGSDGITRQGHGLLGMHERVALFGGTLDAGDVDGGYRVRARVPLDAEVAP